MEDFSSLAWDGPTLVLNRRVNDQICVLEKYNDDNITGQQGDHEEMTWWLEQGIEKWEWGDVWRIWTLGGSID